MGNTTDKIKKGIKDAAGAVKQAAERGNHSPYKVANFFFRGWTPQDVDRSERRHSPP